MTIARKWSLVAALLAVAIFVAGWYLLISPKRSEAGELRTKAVTQEDDNARLAQQIQVLQAQQEDLPTQRARLAAIKTNVPENPALPTLIRDLTAAGRKVGVSIDSMAPSVPVAVVAPVAAVVPVAPAPAATTETSDSDSAAGTTPPAPVTPVVVAPSLYQVPLTLEVTGTYFELEQFVNKLEKLRRSLLVAGFTISEATSETAAEGDISLSLQGRVFLSPKGALAASTTTTTPVAPATNAQ